MAEGTGGMNINRLISLMGVIIVIMVAVAAVAGVYLLLVKPMMEGNTLSGDFYSSTDDVSGSGDYSAPRTTAKAVIVSQGSASSSAGSVNIVDPFLPDDPDYYGPEITSIGHPPDESSVQNVEKIYSETGLLLNYTALSYNVNVPKGPLYICFKVYPKTGYSDNIDDNIAYSAKYVNGVNPHYTFMYIKVYDLQTGDLVADEGYLREYSGQTEKEILVLREGDFRIDIYGRMVRIDFTISSGV